jgi:signal transduction histidine kinase
MNAPPAADGMVVDLTDLVRKRVAEWEPRFRARGKTLRADVQEAAVVGPGDGLALAIDALLSNAMRFSDHGDHAHVALSKRDAQVVLQVTDTGIGIPPDELGRVFVRGFRGSRGRDRGAGGSGLGLTVVRELAEAHGGDVRCSSVVDEGSCFTLLLPAAPAAANPQPQAAERPPA